MIDFPGSPVGFLDNLGLSIRHHFQTFRHIYWLILLVVIVKDAYIYLGGYPSNVYLSSLLTIVMVVLFCYLLALMLYICASLFKGDDTTLKSAAILVFFRFRKVLVSLLMLVLIPFILYSLANWLLQITHAYQNHHSQGSRLILVMVAGIPSMLIYLRYFFAIPIMIVDDSALLASFKQAKQLCTKKENWIRVFGIYFFVICIWLLVSTDTLHGHFMAVYKLSALYDLVVFSVALPIMMNFVVLMRHDLALRKSLRDAS
jgi:hypothetical protein